MLNSIRSSIVTGLARVIWRKIPNLERGASKEPDFAAYLRARKALEKGMREPNPGEAIRKLTDLAERGSISSMLLLGYTYQKGEGVKADMPLAEKFLRQAAAAGSLTGYEYLARLYLREKRYQDARRVCTYAAEKGYPPASNLLGVMYWRGHGMSTDLARARVFFSDAAQQGSFVAKAWLGHVILQQRGGLLERLRATWLIFTALLCAVVEGITTGLNSDRLR